MNIFTKVIDVLFGGTYGEEVPVPVETGAALEMVDLGIPDEKESLTEERVTYGLESEDKQYVHWFKSMKKVVVESGPNTVGYHSYRRTFHRQHNYVGSHRLPQGWKFDPVNYRIISPSRKFFRFEDLFPYINLS